MSELTLSVLIATYNWPCYHLAAQLAREAEQVGDGRIEIIVGDDASSDGSVVAHNRCVEELPCVRYVRVESNLGRARIRNYLARLARGRYLLFVDSDAAVLTSDFLRRYLDCVPDHRVVVGGIRTPEHPQQPGYALRWTYEHRAERIRTLAFRCRHPHQYLSAFNLLIERRLFLQFLFDECCSAYGYEDAALGIALKRSGIPIYHIDNPLLHTGIDTSAQYLSKVRTSLRTLHTLGSAMRGESAVMRLRDCLDRYRLSRIAQLLFRLSEPMLRHNLLSEHPSMTLFKLYKIGYFCSLSREETLPADSGQR